MRKVWICLILFFVLFSFLPTFYELKRSNDVPQNRSFELIHNYITDYNFYLSRIRQGWEGNITVHEIYTNEPHHGTIIHELYLGLGALSRFIPDGTIAVNYAYHVARFVFGLLLVALIAWLATVLFQGVFWQIIAFLLVMTAAGWPLVSVVGTTWRLNNYMPWWTVLEPLQRITFIPHILAAQAGVLFLILAGSTAATISRKGNWLFLGFVAMATGIVMPQALMTVFGVYGLVTFMELIWWEGKRSKKALQVWFLDIVVPRILICAMSVWTILYFLPLLTEYPWKRLVDFEILHPIAFSYTEYLKTLGLSLPLGILGMIIVLIKKVRAWYPIVAWAGGILGLVFVLTYFPFQHPLRFTEMAVYIPLGLLTAYLFTQCLFWIRHLHQGDKQYAAIAVYTLCFLSILYGVMAMYHQFLWQRDFIDMKVRAGWPVISMDNYIVYPTTGFIDAISFIERETPQDAVVLSAMVAGNYIPARTGRRVYLGHENTSYKEEKVEIVQQFFSGILDAQTTYEWIHKEGISYVFWGPQEKKQGGDADIALKYPYLRQIFQNADVTIFVISTE